MPESGSSSPLSNRVFVLSGPTAVGKGTVVRRVQQAYPQVHVTVSATTRPPRPGEVDGRDYHFLAEEEFDRLIASAGLLEWACVHGAARYGTLRSEVNQALAKAKTVLLEIDLQGARQVRQTLPEALHIFLAPPSWEELRRRLVGRGTEDHQEQRRRLETAAEEMAAQSEFDHVIVNEDVEQAAQELVGLLGLSPGAGQIS